LITQIHHLIEMSHRPYVGVGVIPWGAQAQVFPPYGFDLYYEHTVAAGVVAVAGGVASYGRLG
jgi:hypothetical protein